MFFGPGFRLSELRAARAPVDGPDAARLKEVVMIRSKFLYATTVFVVFWGSMVVAVGAQSLTATADADRADGLRNNTLSKIRHLVVIYQENHSFDNLYGAWEGVNGRASADPAQTIQIGQGGVPYSCLLQNEVNLASPQLPATCTDTTTGMSFSSAFSNQPFSIEAYIPSSAHTCPLPGVSFAGGSSLPNPNNLPGGCTRDIVHKFYQEQYQLNNGQQNRYVAGSDAIGMTMGYYDTSSLPIYQYLHSPAHPHYAIADDFFQGAFGGSFLNHQWLIAAATP